VIAVLLVVVGPVVIDVRLLSVFVLPAVFSDTATGRTLVNEFARDVHKQDL
jgi:hypothetical protein